jgi:hypothetical protein
MQKIKKRKGAWDIYKTAICKDQHASFRHHGDDGNKRGLSATSSFLEKSAEIAASLLGNKSPAFSGSTNETRLMDLEKRLESLERRQIDQQGSIQLSFSSVSSLKKEMEFKVHGISEQMIKQTSAMESLIQGLKQTELKHEAKIRALELASARLASASHESVPQAGKKEVTPSAANKKQAAPLPERRNLRSGKVPVTRTHFECGSGGETSSASESEEEEEETDSEKDNPSIANEETLEELLLLSDPWNNNADGTEPPLKDSVTEHNDTTNDNNNDNNNNNNNKIHENDIQNHHEDGDESDAQQGNCDGMHNTLHQVIIGLRSQTYTQHHVLDSMVIELRDVADLDYPAESPAVDVSTRQAMILKLITCFYQTVCVISMETGRPCEQIYGNPVLLQQVTERVQAMV